MDTNTIFELLQLTMNKMIENRKRIPLKYNITTDIRTKLFKAFILFCEAVVRG